MSRVYLALIGLLFAQGLVAQGTVVRPEPALDPGRATVRDALLRFRDSLRSIDAAASRLQRDYRQASTASLISRARVMREACARSVRNLPPTRQAVLAAAASDERQLRRRGEMVGALDQLQKALARCESEFAVISRPGEG
jgi:aminoglycoside phosphotransferase (APT) family kinase protein